MKKKIFLFLISILTLTGCADLINTPTRKTEELFGKYQMLDEDITGEIDSLLSDGNLTSTQQDRYRKILEKQYKNLVYDVKEETINGDDAIVTVEIEVLDYRKAVRELENENQETTSYQDRKLDALEKTKDKVKYTLEISLSKIDDTWQVNPLSTSDIKKIQGMY